MFTLQTLYQLKAWRKRFCMSKLKPAQTINGKSGDNNIIDKFSTFYKTTCIPNTPHTDQQFACCVEKLLQQNALQANNSDGTFIYVDLLGDCIDNLKLHKAAGHDGLTGECRDA